MRKIEQWMIDTIKSNHNHFDKNAFSEMDFDLKKDNTRVKTRKRMVGDIITSVYLYDNLIAEYDPSTGWVFKMCGWNTPTTRSRINAIAKEWGRSGVCMRKGILYSGSEVVTSVDWF